MSIPASVGLQAVRAIAALLNVEGAPAPVERTDTTEYTEERLPAYNVFRAKDKFSDDGAHRVAGSTFDVTIRAMVKATSEADEAVDPLIVFAWQQVMRDETLGNLVEGARIAGVDYQYVDKGEYDMLAAEIAVEVKVDVARSDPTQNLTYGE